MRLSNAIDRWNIIHILAGFLFGYFLNEYIPLLLFTFINIGWEILEIGIFKVFNLARIPFLGKYFVQETPINKVMDIAITEIGFLIGFYIKTGIVPGV